MIVLGEKAGIHFLFNQASTGRVSGITYFFKDFKARGQALGNQFKWAELIKKVSYDQLSDSSIISKVNSRTIAKFGLLSQEEVLLKYCEINKIQVRKTIFEDHSAKTFIRPEWSKLIIALRLQKNKTDLVLFTKWDRFSRNAPDAYQMIATLKKLGVEPQALNSRSIWKFLKTK